MKKINSIVFIDDDEATNAYHKVMCEKIGCGDKVKFFPTAQSALDYLKSIGSKYDFPDLIFVDINMPEMNGHEFVTQVQDMSGYNPDRTTIAHLTASLDIKDVIKSDENEVEHYYFKPIKELELVKLIDENF
jgi:two-component SAPR family response regulator